MRVWGGWQVFLRAESGALCYHKLLSDLFIYTAWNNCIISAATKRLKGSTKIPQDVYESLKTPITFPFIFKGPWRIACCGRLWGEGCWEEVFERRRMKGVRTIFSGAEWGSVSRLSHTLACSMLLELHKLPHNYPEGGQTARRGWEWKRIKENWLKSRPSSGGGGTRSRCWPSGWWDRKDDGFVIT